MKHARPFENDLDDRLVDVEGDDLRLLKDIVEWFVLSCHLFLCLMFHHSRLITKRFDIGYINYPAPERRLIQFPHLRSTRRKSVILPVFGHRDLREIVFRYCGFMTLCCLSTVCTELHAHVSLFFASHVRSVLSFAFDHPSHKPFMKFLHRHQSFIVGSAAYQILDPRVDFPLKNLNIVSTCGAHAEWVRAFIQLGCVEHDVKPRMREEFHRFVGSHVAFLSPKMSFVSCTFISSL